MSNGINIMNRNIAQLKEDMLYGEFERMQESAKKLIEIGGPEISNLFISLLESENPAVRNIAALCLADMKEQRAVGPLLKSIFVKENLDANGTLVYALQFLDFSKRIKELFKILFYCDYEPKLSAFDILSEQIFEFSQQDIYEIFEMWEDCKRNPQKCPHYNNLEVRAMMEDSVEGFRVHLAQ